MMSTLLPGCAVIMREVSICIVGWPCAVVIPIWPAAWKTYLAAHKRSVAHYLAVFTLASTVIHK